MMKKYKIASHIMDNSNSNYFFNTQTAILDNPSFYYRRNGSQFSFTCLIIKKSFKNHLTKGVINE
jgi:hypothetical protein